MYAASGDTTDPPPQNPMMKTPGTIVANELLKPSSSQPIAVAAALHVSACAGPMRSASQPMISPPQAPEMPITDTSSAARVWPTPNSTAAETTWLISAIEVPNWTPALTTRHQSTLSRTSS